MGPKSHKSPDRKSGARSPKAKGIFPSEIAMVIVSCLNLRKWGRKVQESLDVSRVVETSENSGGQNAQYF